MKVNVLTETGISVREFDVTDGTPDYEDLVTAIRETFSGTQNYSLLWKGM
jgi:hypothetical protein